MGSINTSDLFNINGIVAVITGGGTGIGLMMAKALAFNGASKVYIIGRREDMLREAASLHPNIIPLPGDITSKDELKSMAEKVRQDCGYVDLVVANAGMTGPGLESLKPRHTLKDFVDHAWSSSMDELNAVYELNCTALIYTVLAFLELLDEGNKRRKGSPKSQVIATASTASYLRNPRAGFAYTSSKAAVISLIKSLSTFCVPWGIRFNAIDDHYQCFRLRLLRRCIILFGSIKQSPLPKKGRSRELTSRPREQVRSQTWQGQLYTSLAKLAPL